MRKNRLILSLVSIVAIIAFIAVFHSLRQQKNAVNRSPDVTGEVRDADRTTTTSTQTTTAVPSLSNKQDASRIDSAILKRHEITKSWVQEQNVEIDFFGKVVDQNDKPVAGAKIKAHVRQWYLKSLLDPDARSVQFVTETKDDGSFRISGGNGDVFSVDEIIKEGYEVSSKRPKSFDYTRGAEANPNSPVIFKMWKKVGADTLVTGGKFWGVKPNGQTYVINFLQNTKSEVENSEGDLRIQVNRPEGVKRRDKYDWSFTITPFGGGVIETEDEFMYLAPEVGYKPTYKFEQIASNPKWSSRIKKRFFVKSRGELFSRIEMEVFAFYDNEAVFDIKYATNPSGSRNLEH